MPRCSSGSRSRVVNSSALSSSRLPRPFLVGRFNKGSLVGGSGFEPETSRSRTVRAAGLRQPPHNRDPNSNCAPPLPAPRQAGRPPPITRAWPDLLQLACSSGCFHSVRPFRFGVLAESAQTAEQLLDTARRAEDAGFSILLIRDHLVQDPFPHQLGPLTALAAVASATRTLRVGTLVISNDFRHPAVLAKEVATLDVLSGGRVELGMGAGFLRRDYDEAGLPFDEPRDRVGRLEEALRLLKALFGPDPVTHHGQHYAVERLDGFPKPVQRPHPPLQVAAARPRMLAIAAREADIVSLQTVSTAGGVLTDDPAGRSAGAVADQIARLRDAAGDRFDQLALSTTAAMARTG